LCLFFYRSKILLPVLTQNSSETLSDAPHSILN
jgi:hypothetical protein